jgi:2,3-dihydro-2,3-dihydroxybenzoate dehydrogenase
MSGKSGPAPVIVVTGAAGGIGQAVVRRQLSEGSIVVAVDTRTVPRLGGGLDGSGRFVRRRVDVGSPTEVDALACSIIEDLGRVDGVVSSAGVLRASAALEPEPDRWHELFEVNFFGAALVCARFAQVMCRQGAGSIVAIGSNAGLVPRLGMASYCASKAALAMFTKCLGLEVAASGVRCNVVAPGSTDTPMLHALWSTSGGCETTIRGSLASYKTGIPLRRIAEPADIAATVGYLLSAESRHITMQVLTVDGGATLGI